MSYTPWGGIQSTGNSTTTGADPYTGTWEQNALPDVMCSCYSSGSGTLYFDFSVNGTDARTFPPAGFTVAAGIHEFHTAVKGPRYFRVRFVPDSGAPATFQLFTYYGTFAKAPNAPINFDIGTDADAIVTKSVISGVGNTTATVTDHKSLQVTPPAEGKTAFGEVLTGSLEPIAGLTFPYSVIPYLVKSEANQSGTNTIDTSMIKLSTGAAANSSACIKSIKKIKYQPGLGLRARFTGLFTTGVANSTQIIGVGDAGEGFFFGYNGTSFGVMRRYGGNPEIRTFQVTTASTTAEDITITLDGDADATVTVTNSGVITTTANEIAAHDYSDVGRGWDAKAVGDKVYFISWDAAPHTGTYSYSATTAVGSFASVLTGVAPTETWVPQASWNGADIFDGNGLTGVTLDPTKGNVFQIDFQYLGFGAIRFYIEDPDDGELHLVHTLEYSNANTRPSLDNPSISLMACVENTSNPSDIILKSASMAAFLDGIRRNQGVNRGISADTTLSTANETPVTTIRVVDVFKSKINRSKVKMNYVAASCEHTKPVFINFYANATLVGASFTNIDTNGDSTVEQDTSATSVTGGILLFSLPLGKTGQQLIDLKDDLDLGEFQAGDTLTLAAAPRSGTNAEVSVSINFTEDI